MFPDSTQDGSIAESVNQWPGVRPSVRLSVCPVVFFLALTRSCIISTASVRFDPPVRGPTDVLLWKADYGVFCYRWRCEYGADVRQKHSISVIMADRLPSFITASRDFSGRKASGAPHRWSSQVAWDDVTVTSLPATPTELGTRESLNLLVVLTSHVNCRPTDKKLHLKKRLFTRKYKVKKGYWKWR